MSHYRPGGHHGVLTMPLASPRGTVRPSPARHVASALRIGSLAAMMALAACAKNGVDTTPTGSIGGSATAALSSVSDKPVDQMTQAEISSATTRYTAAYEKNPNDKRTGLTFAQLLAKAGRDDQALAVMRKVAITHSEDREVLAAYGKAQAGAGDFKGALNSIRNAQTPDAPDWKLMSAEGAIHDQLGNSRKARELYRAALDLAPQEASILSNLGMSYVLEGDLRTAEQYLSSAASAKGADSRIRQNLALVVGLQGRFDEAEDIARRELSSEQADANVSYIRSMLSQRDDWKQLNDEA